MAQTTKYVLVIFCICGAANILYLIATNKFHKEATPLDKIEMKATPPKVALDKIEMKATPATVVLDKIETKATSTKVTLDKFEKKATVAKVALNKIEIKAKPEIDTTIELAPDARKLKQAHMSLPSENEIEHEKDVHKGEQYTFAINQQRLCKGNDGAKLAIDIVVVVISDIRHFLKRMAIRNSWGSDVYENLHSARLVFLVGRNVNVDTQSQLEKESELFSDIIQVNIDDIYPNLTNKSIAMLQWLKHYCSEARFALKSDDDMYINLPVLVQELYKRKETKFFLCCSFTDAPPIRDKLSKWYTSYEEYKYKYFPKYCSGTAYSFSVNIVTELHEMTKKTTFLKMEDVYITGLLPQTLNIPVIHHNGFWFLKRKSSGCEYKNAISGHEVSVEDMYVIYAQLKDTAIDCEKNINNAIAGDENDIFQKWHQNDVT